jgi:hypothetical protein
MADDEIRKLVRAKLADGTLPREPPERPPGRSDGSTEYLVSIGSAKDDPCAVCGRRATEIGYAGSTLALHHCCHAIWREEAGW